MPPPPWKLAVVVVKLPEITQSETVQRPYRKIWKITADVGPRCPAVRRLEHIATGCEVADDRIRRQRTCRTHLDILDRAANWKVV